MATRWSATKGYLSAHPVETLIGEVGVRRRVWAYTGQWCRYREIMRDTTDREGAMALKLDVSRTEDIAVVRCRGRIVFGEEADELRRVVLGLLNETKRIVL